MRSLLIFLKGVGVGIALIMVFLLLVRWLLSGP